MGLAVTIMIMIVITNCEGTSKMNHRESQSTWKEPLIYSQSTLHCARVLSEKNMTELWARLDWLKCLVLQIAGEHSHDKIAVFAIGSNILMQALGAKKMQIAEQGSWEPA